MVRDKKKVKGSVECTVLVCTSILFLAMKDDICGWNLMSIGSGRLSFTRAVINGYVDIPTMESSDAATTFSFAIPMIYSVGLTSVFSLFTFVG